jgi:hypothetical protein
MKSSEERLQKITGNPFPVRYRLTPIGAVWDSNYQALPACGAKYKDSPSYELMKRLGFESAGS